MTSPSLWITENHNYERPCMITCALSGVVANRDQCPAIPYTPEEYATEAKRAYEAGAAVVCVEYDRAPMPFGVDRRRGGRDHVWLARCVVFPGKD